MRNLRRVTPLVLLVGCLLSSAAPAAFAWQDDDNTPDVVYVPTPNDVVRKMLEMAEVKKEDVVYDLGCGDVRIVVTAAVRFGCQGVGYDIDPERIKESLANVKKFGVSDLVTIKEKNIFKEDLKPASVITLYLLPSLNKRLVPQLNKLKPGSRIVSHNYDIEGIQPEKTIEMKSKEDGASHTIHLWITPLKRVETSEPAVAE